jgi:hypothetical protein
MKNLRKPICLAISLFMTITLLQAKNVENNIVLVKKNNTVEAFTNPIFYELMYKINHSKCLQLEVSAMSINKSRNQSFMNSYTSYGRESLIKENNYTLKSARSVNMEFSDRNNFAGAKTRESFKIYGRTNTISVEIKLETWGNKTIVLRNVEIHKDGFGYFITGRVTDGNRTVYYTLGIYEVACLI